MYAQASSDRQYQGINRTVCIGIGGTGRDVLMRIRRLLVDRYGDLNKLPVVNFVHIDTDSAAAKVSGLRTGNTYHGVDLSFRDAEKVSATMTAAEVSDFIQGVERRPNDRPGPYDHIAQWFPPQLLRNIRAIEQGAKGIRPVGRLAFFHNYLKIKSAIESAEQRTKGHEQFLFREWNLIVDPGLNIFIVGSLCGGTGSGMFLDTAYSRRNAYTGVQIAGYLVISPELYGNTPNMCANTYAALMELDYYSTPGTKFEVCYDQQHLKFVQEKRSPFDYAYLIANHTEQGNYSIHEQGKLCNVIAHKIALDFSGELAPVVKSMRDNFNPHMLQEDEHPRPNHQGYLTFGLAAIYFPRDAIANIATTRVKSELVSFWLQGKGQSPDPHRLLEQFLIESRWHTDLTRKDGLVTRLEATPLESEKSFSGLMSAWKNKQESAITECKNKDDRTNVMRQLLREFREQFRKTIFGDTESTRGTWLTKLQGGRLSLANQLAHNIDDFLNALLTPGNPNFSIRNTRNWLDALQTELNGYQNALEERITKLNAARKLEELEKKWKELDQTVEDFEKKFQLHGKNSGIQEELRKALREADSAIKHNFDFAVVLETLEILKALQEHVQKQISQLTSLNYWLESLKSAYEREQEALKQLNLDEMSGEAIFANEDIDSCCNVLLPQKELRTQLVQITEELIEPLGRGKSLVSMIDQVRTNREQLQQEINLTVDRLFGSRTASIVQSVIKRFHESYPTTGRAARLAQILREAEPLLPLKKDKYFYDNPAKSSKLIGFKNTDESEVQQFKSTLSRDLNIPDNVFRPTQAEDEIIIVTEYAAFPLRLINGLEQLRNHYIHARNLPNSFLHNDRHHLFTDIIPPDVRIMEDLQEILYPCLALELIQQNQVTGQLEFKYYDELRDEYYSASLSPSWNQALEELANRADMTEALKQLFDEAITDIKHQPIRWEEHYLKKLRQFITQVDRLPDSDINYLHRSRVVGTLGTADTPAKEGILSRFLKRMQNKVTREMPDQNFYRPALPARQKVIAGAGGIVDEVVSEVIAPYADSVNAVGNRANRRRELEQLKQDLADGIIILEEYEDQRQAIINKYPLR